MSGLADAGLEGSSLPLFESVARLRHAIGSRYQQHLDRTTRHTMYRWIATGVLLFTYFLRVYLLQGFYVVTYGLALYTLNLLIGFLSPLNDPDENEDDGTELPINAVTPSEGEWKPFMRKVPEFKFWYDHPHECPLCSGVCGVSERPTSVRASSSPIATLHPSHATTP